MNWVNPPFFRNNRRGDQDFLVKMGRGVGSIGGLSMKGGKKCFSLIMYRFCGSNALFSVTLSFRIFIFDSF